MIFFDSNVLVRFVRKSFLGLLCVFPVYTYSQIGLLSTNTYHRDYGFVLDASLDSNSNAPSHLMSSGFVFPMMVSSSALRIGSDVRFSGRRWFGRKLFSEHLLELQDSSFYLNADLLVDLRIMQQLNANNDADPKYINTRGIQVQGGIGKYFAFYSALLENQAFFFDFQSEEIKKGGVVVTNQAGTQNQSGGFVSGANRTKPFKTGGFDYAMAFGSFVFKPTEYLSFIAGNNPLFIGAGHRSLIYSDHSGMMPNFRTKWTIRPWVNAEWVYGQHWNMIRLNANTLGTERLHEKKGFSLKSLNFNFGKSIQFSLFEASNWLHYENDELNRLSGWFYNPIFGVNAMALGLQGDRVHSVLGSQMIFQAFKRYYFYNQITFNRLHSDNLSYQFGLRAVEPFGVKNLQALVEYNQLPDGAYQHANVRLNYSNSNVGIAHPLGTGLTELLGQVRYCYKRIGLNAQANIIQTVRDLDHGYNGISVAPINRTNTATVETTILYGQFDLFYRFNPTTDMQVFISGMFRNQVFGQESIRGAYFSFGFRTIVGNRYLDL